MDTSNIQSISGIYQIKNINNGKVYIGSAVNCRNRQMRHARELFKGKHHSSKLQKAWDKYQPSSFEFSILEIVPDTKQLILKEQVWIDMLDSSKNGYNIAPTAGSALGVKRSQETKNKMSSAQKGKKRTPAQVAAHIKLRTGMKLKPRTPEHCRALSLALMGNAPTEATRKKLSESHKGQISWSKGATLSDEHKRKLSESHQGYVMPLSQKLKIAEAQRQYRAKKKAEAAL